MSSEKRSLVQENRRALRAIPTPTQKVSRDKTLTKAGRELHEIRKPGGNIGRSLSMVGNNPPYSSVGLVVGINPDQCLSVDYKDSESGKGKKNEFYFKKPLPREQLLHSLDIITSHDFNFMKESDSLHDEVLGNIQENNILGIYYYDGVTLFETDLVKSDDYYLTSQVHAFHWSTSKEFLKNAPLIQAIFVKNEYSKMGLHIYRYCPGEDIPLQYIADPSEEEILELWLNQVDAFLSFIEKNDLFGILCMTPENVKNMAIFGFHMYPFENEILHADMHYSEELKKKLDGMIKDRLQKKMEFCKQEVLKKINLEDLGDEVDDVPFYFNLNKKYINAKDAEEKIDFFHNMEDRLDRSIQQYVSAALMGEKFTNLRSIITGFIYLERIKQLGEFILLHEFIDRDEVYDILCDLYANNILKPEKFYQLNSELGGIYTDNLFKLINAYFFEAGYYAKNGKLDADQVFSHIAIAEAMNLNNRIYYYSVPLYLQSINIKNQHHVLQSVQLLRKFLKFKYTDNDLDPDLLNPGSLVNRLHRTSMDIELCEEFKKRLVKFHFKSMKVLLSSLYLNQFLLYRRQMQGFFNESYYSFQMERLANDFFLAFNRFIQKKVHHTHTYFYGASAEIPFNLLKMGMKFHSPKNQEFGTLHQRLFELAMVLGIRISIQNPVHLSWYLNKLKKTLLPLNMHHVLHALLGKTLFLYPQYRENPVILDHIIQLHPEFDRAIQMAMMDIQTIPPILAVAEVSRNWISPRIADILNYVKKNFLNSIYDDEMDNVSEFPVIYLRNGKPAVSPTLGYGCFPSGNNDTCHIYRSNHGVPHTARKLLEMLPVIDFNLVHAAEPVKNYLKNQCSTPKMTAKFLMKLQAVLCFGVTGRKGESGFKDDEALYKQYREQSARNFREYALRFGGDLFKTFEQIYMYASCLEHHFPMDISSMNLKSPMEIEEYSLKVLLSGAHCLDLIRIYSPEIIESKKVLELMKAVPSARSNQEAIHDALKLFHWAGTLCKSMGDSVYTVYNESKRKCEYLMTAYSDLYDTAFPKTDIELFIEYSNNPKKLVQLLNSVDMQFTSDVMQKFIKKGTEYNPRLFQLVRPELSQESPRCSTKPDLGDSSLSLG